MQVFEALLQGVQALLSNHLQSYCKCDLAVFAYREKRFFKVCLFMCAFIISSFSSRVKPFDIKGLSKWDKGSNARGGLFPSSEQNEDRMGAHRCMCTPSRNMHTGSHFQRTPALRHFKYELSVFPKLSALLAREHGMLCFSGAIDN